MTITLTREEAQQVLDALDEYYITTDEGKKLVETLRARLSAPEPEPVAWMNESDIGKTDWKVWAHGKPTATIPLYAAECMPDDLIATYEKGVADGKAKREWQGLTDEEMSAAMDYWSDPVRSAYGGAHSADGEYVSMIDTWQYIEAKLKEKNT
jgi:hypothetical protein